MCRVYLPYLPSLADEEDFFKDIWFEELAIFLWPELLRAGVLLFFVDQCDKSSVIFTLKQMAIDPQF